MDASPEAPSELPKNTCPFCRKEFRRIENHVKRGRVETTVLT